MENLIKKQNDGLNVQINDICYTYYCYRQGIIDNLNEKQTIFFYIKYSDDV